jgi:hypothetical protein
MRTSWFASAPTCADTKEEYTAQTKVADDWVQKALATKKRKAEQKRSFSSRRNS